MDPAANYGMIQSLTWSEGITLDGGDSVLGASKRRAHWTRSNAYMDWDTREPLGRSQFWCYILVSLILKSHLPYHINRRKSWWPTCSPCFDHVFNLYPFILFQKICIHRCLKQASVGHSINLCDFHPHLHIYIYIYLYMYSPLHMRTSTRELKCEHPHSDEYLHVYEWDQSYAKVLELEGIEQKGICLGS